MSRLQHHLLPGSAAIRRMQQSIIEELAQCGDLVELAAASNLAEQTSNDPVIVLGIFSSVYSFLFLS